MSDLMLPYFISYLIAFIIAVLITRAIFSISTMVKNLQAQTAFLYHLSKAQGIDEGIIREIGIRSGVNIPIKKSKGLEEANRNEIQG